MIFPHVRAKDQLVIHLTWREISNSKDNKLSWPQPAHPPSENSLTLDRGKNVFDGTHCVPFYFNRLRRWTLSSARRCRWDFPFSEDRNLLISWLTSREVILNNTLRESLKCYLKMHNGFVGSSIWFSIKKNIKKSGRERHLPDSRLQISLGQKESCENWRNIMSFRPVLWLSSAYK